MTIFTNFKKLEHLKHHMTKLQSMVIINRTLLSAGVDANVSYQSWCERVLICVEFQIKMVYKLNNNVIMFEFNAN